MRDLNIEALGFIFISVILAGIICLGSFVIAIRRPTSEKVSAYECGFDPFVDSRGKFEIRFFLVGILFIIFDLEISFLFPWTQLLTQINYWMIVCFLSVLTLGLAYEWKLGALEWE